MPQADAGKLMPPGSAAHFVDVDGGRVRVLQSTAEPVVGADNAPLLLIHGGGTDNAAISWYEVFEPLGGDRRVIALDLPGFGRTEGIEPVGGAPEMADFVARVAARLGVSEAVVMGVSMGGDIALNLALRHPELVRSLVVIAPGGLVPIFRNRFAQFAAWLGTRLPDRLLVPLARVANRHVDRAIKAVVKDPSTMPQEVLAEFVREARKPRAGMAYALYNKASAGPRSMRNYLVPAVERITVPALLFHGTDDPIVDPEGSRRAAAIMPAAQLVLVPDCGHWAQLESRDRFLDEVRPFLHAHGRLASRD